MSNDSAAVILFSGGADSSLVSLMAIEKHRNIFLLTFKNGFELFIGRSSLMARRIKKKYKTNRVVHEIIDSSRIFNSILRDRIATKDTISWKRYFNNLTLLCCAERIAMYIHAVMFCLEKQIQYVYDGSSYRQGQIAVPQMPEVLDIIKYFFKHYDITYDNPIYQCPDVSEGILLKKGLIRKDELYQQKRLFFKKDAFLLLDVICGFWNKLTNKLHPIFFIETGLQLLGRITRFKKYSYKRKQKKIKEAIIYYKEKFGSNKGYLEKYFVKCNKCITV